MNSVWEEFYNRYYWPVGYTFADVAESVRIAKKKGMFTMINYLVFLCLTDHHDEVDALLIFFAANRVEMIQMRNLAIDPYFL